MARSRIPAAPANMVIVCPVYVKASVCMATRGADEIGHLRRRLRTRQDVTHAISYRAPVDERLLVREQRRVPPFIMQDGDQVPERIGANRLLPERTP